MTISAPRTQTPVGRADLGQWFCRGKYRHVIVHLGLQNRASRSVINWLNINAATFQKEDEAVISVQVNGKLKARLTVEVGLANDVLEAMALGNADVAAAMEGKVARKVVVVPGRLVNIVV